MHTILIGDARTELAALPDQSVQMCVTSPPYFGLRDYGHEGQIGLESTVEDYVNELVAVFREVRRVLKDDGTLWLNLGDSYAGGGGFAPNAPSNNPGGSGLASSRPNLHKALIKGRAIPEGLKPKDLIGIPWRVALALQADGWWLRQDIIWHKPNPMPESVRDRCTKSHEYIFLLSKSSRYYFDADAIAEPAVEAGKVIHSYNSGAKNRQNISEVNNQRTRIGIANWNKTVPETRNRRDVWSITTKPYSGAHFAVFPPELPELCIKAGSRPGDVVLDPFGGSGTTAQVADRLGRDSILIELNPDNKGLIDERLRQPSLLGVSHV